MRLTGTATLAALAIVLSFLEGMLPELPVPGARLGLSNLAVMTAIEIYGVFGGCGVFIIKAAFALLTRGGTAGMMSFFGGALSTLFMWLVLKHDKNSFGYVGVGIIGAAAHNTGQLCAAFLLMGGVVKYYLPFFLLTGIATGAVTGLVNGILLSGIEKSGLSSEILYR